MGRCKEIEIKVIPSNIANAFVRKHHYSGKVVPNSVLHFGAFLDGRLHGVLSYGNSMDKRKTMALVEGTGWNEFLELNRMAFDDYLPRNSESYCIGATLRMIKKKAPHVKWIISFADGTQCGDGTIYRASNFVLTGINKNTSCMILPNGEKINSLLISAHPDALPLKKCEEFLGIGGGRRTVSDWIALGAKRLEGYQLRYIYFLDKSYRKRLTVPELPFSAIDEAGAGMYKGENITQAERHAIKTQTNHEQTDN